MSFFWPRKGDKEAKDTVVFIPTINDGVEDFKKIAELYARVVLATAPGITWAFDFTRCNFLRPAAVAALGGIIKEVEIAGGTVALRRTTIPKGVRTALQKNGFLAHYGVGSDERYTENAVRFRHDSVLDEDGIAAYLDKEWLAKGWIFRSRPDVRYEILSGAVELFNNAFEHGEPATGVFSCGQRFPNLRDVQLCVVDFGHGLPQIVRDFLRRGDMRDFDCLEWALKKGTTTRPSHSRGLGLFILTELVAGDGSHLEIYSGKGMVRVERGKTFPRPVPFWFPGTAVQITINSESVGHMVLNRELPPVVF